MRIGIYPGSFDPITNGHLDIIHRGSQIVDKLIVGVLNNDKKTPLFSVNERMEMLKQVTAEYKTVEVQTFSGLLIDFAHEQRANLIMRGIRAVTDFEYELQMAQTNYNLDGDIETIFLATNVQYSFLSSSIVKEVARFGGHIDNLVPPIVVNYLEQKYSNI